MCACVCRYLKEMAGRCGAGRRKGQCQEATRAALCIRLIKASFKVCSIAPNDDVQF